MLLLTLATESATAKGSVNSAATVKTRPTGEIAKQAQGMNYFPSAMPFFFFNLASFQKVLPLLGVSCPTSIKTVRSSHLNLKFGKLILKPTITVYVYTWGGQKASDLLELKLQAVVRPSVWMLRTEFG